MALKDYYKILGVPRDADSKGIRDAFRRLAKKYHPDKAGPGSKGQFQDITEAYEVLSDPEKRNSYDRQVRYQGQSSGLGHRTTVYDSPFHYDSFFGDLFNRRPYSSRWARYRHHTSHAQPDLILVLSQEEAEKGGEVEVTVPFYAPCPQCRGTGEQWFFPCMYCLGEGLVKQRKGVRISIPVGVKDGAIIEVPLESLGAFRRYLRVLIEVQ